MEEHWYHKDLVQHGQLSWVCTSSLFIMLLTDFLTHTTGYTCWTSVDKDYEYHILHHPCEVSNTVCHCFHLQLPFCCYLSHCNVEFHSRLPCSFQKRHQLAMVASHINYSIPEQDWHLKMQVAQGKLSTVISPVYPRPNLTIFWSFCRFCSKSISSSTLPALTSQRPPNISYGTSCKLIGHS